MKMGNDDFILYVRKHNPRCKLENDLLGRKIWEFIREKDPTATQYALDQECLWGIEADNVGPTLLPKTATQFEFSEKILFEIFRFLDTV